MDIAARPLPLSDAPGHAPLWVHVLPAGTFPALGGTRTYRSGDLTSVARQSMASARGKLVVDENHSTDLAAPQGKPAPAMGWITELDVRGDGLWGRVEWTAAGTARMTDHAYRALSPVLVTSGDGTVLRILRVALTNNPDLELETLHHAATSPKNHEKEKAVLSYPFTELRARLGLSDGADRAAVDEALTGARRYTSLHSRLAEMTGLPPTTPDETLLAKAQASAEQITAHAKRTKDLETENAALKSRMATQAAEAFVAEAGRKKAISEGLAKTLITLHAANPAQAQEIVDGLPDAPPSNVTLHQAGQPTHTLGMGKIPGMAAFDAALGLGPEDLAGGAY
ncbi:hypothetical protein E3E12_06050 [Formicincola oecophyllae]|uniref:Mu-like prophage I protein n=1 Tax=Formicincola oecophyllae TaxID=2558361 RepID=A0A4Y6UB68_9PROT|nr:phage protease [Formicincola oecophyllae]QDH13818.1 hypothetical protein E3E12_06050 [Formicincola oecophyllae]